MAADSTDEKCTAYSADYCVYSLLRKVLNCAQYTFSQCNVFSGVCACVELNQNGRGTVRNDSRSSPEEFINQQISFGILVQYSLLWCPSERHEQLKSLILLEYLSRGWKLCFRARGKMVPLPIGGLEVVLKSIDEFPTPFLPDLHVLQIVVDRHQLGKLMRKADLENGYHGIEYPPTPWYFAEYGCSGSSGFH